MSDDNWVPTDRGGLQKTNYQKPYNCKRFKQRKCIACDELFVHLPQRGRPKQKCPECRGIKVHGKALINRA